MTIFVQNRFSGFHHFSIGLAQLSNLFQPFAVGSNQFLASYGLFHCFFTGFQQFFSIYCYHGLSSFVQSISSVSASIFISFLVFWEGFQKEFFVQKCTFGGWIWPATLLGWFCESYFLASLCSSIIFFYNSLFPGNCRPGWTIYTEKCPYLFRIDSIDFIILALVSRNCPTYFSLLPLVPINFWPLMAYFIVFFTGFRQFFNLLNLLQDFTLGCHRLFNLFLVFSRGFL